MADDFDTLEIAAAAGGAELTVKVVPGASRTKIAGVWGHALKLAVSAPPEGGKANKAVVALLAAALGVKTANVEIVSGHTQPVKCVVVRGVSAVEMRLRLRTLGAAAG